MENPKSKSPPREEGLVETLFNLLRSVKLTISLLILLACLSIIGTVIKQNAPKAEYIERYGVDLYNVLNFFNLFDMYHSWWFSLILALLVVNLIACSIRRIPGILREVFTKPEVKPLDDAQVKGLPYVEKIQMPFASGREEEIRSSLKQWIGNPKRLETESSVTLYSEKGRFSRLGFPLTHLSVILILVGGLLGSLYGFRGFVNILEGETVDHFFLRGKDGEIPMPFGFKIRCDEFTITFYDLPGREEKHVKEYASVLTIFDDRKEVLSGKVKVNHPLHYKGMAFYQASYGTLHKISLGIEKRDRKGKVELDLVEGETAFVPNSDAQIRLLRYVPQVHNFGEGVQVALFRPNQPPQAFWILRNFPKFDEQRKDDFILTLENVSTREYTGLQVTKDPGVGIVWVGSGLLILGLIITFFFSHQRVWVRLPKGARGEVVIAGSTNKNRVAFEKAFNRWAGSLRQ